jgi:hypothetical protein
MAGKLENWIVRAYRRFKKRSLRRAIKTADHHVLENLDLARESLRVSQDIRSGGLDIIRILEEIRNINIETIANIVENRKKIEVALDVVEEMRNRGRDTIDIVEEIRDRSRKAIEVAEESRNIGLDTKTLNEETKNITIRMAGDVEETKNRSKDTIDILDEVRNMNRYVVGIVEETKNRSKDIVDIVDEIKNTSLRVAGVADEILCLGGDAGYCIEENRKQNNKVDNRIRRLELYMVYLMKQTGVAPETLSVEASDSQDPATENDIRFMKLEITKSSIVKNINRIRALTELQCRDVEFLEHTLMPELGLADEEWSFPSEIAHMCGKGLHLLQLPCQLAPFLAWLADNASGTKTYLEIGVRWGGMFILMSEWLRRFSPELRRTIALDPAEMSPLIREYDEFISKMDGNDRLEVLYAKEYSTSAAAKDLVLSLKPDFVFIDGDHRYEGVSHDYELVRGQANTLMFHDICASNWPGVGRLWHEAREQNSSSHAAVEFTKQYQAGDGGGMGLGVLKRDVSSPRPQGGDMESAS